MRRVDCVSFYVTLLFHLHSASTATMAGFFNTIAPIASCSFQCVAGFLFFAKIYLKWGYCNFAIHPDDRKWTVTIGGGRAIQWRKVVQGFASSGAFFQYLMQKLRHVDCRCNSPVLPAWPHHRRQYSRWVRCERTMGHSRRNWTKCSVTTGKLVRMDPNLLSKAWWMIGRVVLSVPHVKHMYFCFCNPTERKHPNIHRRK